MENTQNEDRDSNPPSPEHNFSKIKLAINRVNSLTDRLSQNEYPSKYIDLSSKPKLTFNKHTYSLNFLAMTFIMIILHTRLNQTQFTYYRIFWHLIAGPFFYLFFSQVVRTIKNQVFIFYIIRCLSSSLLYGFFFNLKLNPEFHIQSHEYDILGVVFFALLFTLCRHKRLKQLHPYLFIIFLIDFVINISMQAYYNIFNLAPYGYQITLALFLYCFNHILAVKDEQEKAIVEYTVIKHCEDITQELKEIHNNLIIEESNILQLQAPTVSIADEMLMKIKYLKFKMLQEEKEKRFLNTKNSVFGRSRLTRGHTSGNLLGLLKKHEDKVPSVQRRSSYNTLDRSPDGEGTPLSNDVDSTGKWDISPKDCDLLIKMMLDKQATMYYPEALTEENNQINHETAEFLKQHYTEIGNYLLSPRKLEPKNTFTLEPQSFACSPWNEYLETNICNWNFDMLKFKDLTNGRHLTEFGIGIIKRFDVLKTLNVPTSITANFLKDVSEGYLPNPYHNSIHGADVANSIGYFLSNPEFGGHFNQLETSCLILAALVHDVGHPGFNNAFLIATKSTEALLYNDQSVLENLHTAYFFKILQKPSSNILQNLDEKDYKYFRKLSIALILDTDLTKHFVILTKFKGIADHPNPNEEENKFLSMSIALKCADVGHGAKELSLHKKWSRRIIEEFYLQGDKEREHFIPVSPLCDRKGKVSNSQQGFISFICLPLFEAFDKKFFNAKMRKEVTDQVKENLEYWKEEIPREEKGESQFMEETQKMLEDIKSELPHN